MRQLRENRIKRKLANGEVATFLMGHNTANIVDFLGPLGFDGILIEGEHGPVDFADIPDVTRACDLWGMTSIVRVNINLPGVIYRSLDVGAQGVMSPHVNTADEARAIVDAAKFGPIGSRGSATSRQGYGVEDFFAVANDETLVIVLLEDIIAIENLTEILEVDHIDAFYVAPGDLAQSMGYPGQSSHPEVQSTVDETIARIVASGKVAGTVVNDSNVEAYILRGVRCLGTSWTAWVAAGARGYLRKAEAAR